REGHEIKVSVLTKKSPKPPIPPNPKPKSKTTKELLLEFMSKQDAFNKGVTSRFDTIDTRLISLENRMTNVETKLVEHDKRFEKIETILKSQGVLLQTVIKLNNLKTI
ncbi:MAG: hypothetical protein LBS76_00055, partial [Mycoplasmataceae bacterium]|nr:hypothetical protein [Mycoplasmataceae bacterium]